MSDEYKKLDEEIKPKNSSEKADNRLLFLQKEIRKIAKSFVLSWMAGDLKISFPRKKELEVKKRFAELVMISVGEEKATSEEQERAISSLFRMILSFRLGDRIEGKFIGSDIGDIENRLRQVEQDLAKTNKLIEEIVLWIRTQRD